MADSPFLAGNFAPVLDERGPEPCTLSGRLPAALHGTLFRNGANPRWPPAVWRPESGTSALLVLDTAALPERPVAEVLLQRRVPFGFHGSWVPAAAMAAR